MPSTPEQIARRKELKLLTEKLGEIAWKRSPKVAPHAIIDGKNTPSKPGVIDYDEFFVFEHETKAFPAKKTSGKIILRFRRRITKDGKNAALWHIWEPGYSATKPESVDELLPLLRELVGAYTN